MPAGLSGNSAFMHVKTESNKKSNGEIKKKERKKLFAEVET